MTKIKQIEHFQTCIHRFSLLMPTGDFHHHTLYIMYGTRFKSPKKGTTKWYVYRFGIWIALLYQKVFSNHTPKVSSRVQRRVQRKTSIFRHLDSGSFGSVWYLEYFRGAQKNRAGFSGRYRSLSSVILTTGNLDHRGTFGTGDGHKRNEQDPPADRNLSFPSFWQGLIWIGVECPVTCGAGTKGEPQVQTAEADLSHHSLWSPGNLEGTFCLMKAVCTKEPVIQRAVRYLIWFINWTDAQFGSACCLWYPEGYTKEHISLPRVDIDLYHQFSWQPGHFALGETPFVRRQCIQI